MYDTFIPHSLQCLIYFFVWSVLSFISSSCALCFYLRHLSQTHVLHLFLAVFYFCFPFLLYLLLFPFTLTSTYRVPSCSCQFDLFIQYASPSLVWCFPFSISALQFSSSVFHLSRHHPSVTLDVFHFSSFYSDLSLHSPHWCYFSSARFWSRHLLSFQFFDFRR